MRATWNPALNLAATLANQLKLPLLVYQGLRPDYPWATARTHTFILESVRDLAQEFARRRIQYAFHLEPSPRRRSGVSPLVALADRAALVVTDFFPTFIVPRQIAGLRRRTGTPVIPVETGTVVPLRELDRPWATARGIRPRLQKALPHYLHPIPDVAPKARRSIDLPFDPVVPTTATIAGLVAGCDVDHGIPPSDTLRGGAVAAREMLDRFLARGLPRYADHRNDPNAGGTSGLSPYLHFGNISIQEVLLEAREAGSGENWQKFLDEALVWRELGWNNAWFDPHHADYAAIPEWARDELADHADDPRPALYTEAELAEGRTGDELWNACQQSLVRTGSLHGWLRMLWGKALLQWTRTPEEAYRVAVDLNNRFALDGRDPNSWSGIQWCFGRYDRPFFRRPIYGTVRYMSLAAARKKFDARAFIDRQMSLL